MALKDNLLGCWELNETSGTNADDAHSGNLDGTYTGTISINQTGKIGRAVTLSGAANSGVYLPAGAKITGSGNRTITCWVNPNITDWVPVWAFGDGATNQWFSLYLNVTSGTNRMVLQKFGTTHTSSSSLTVPNSNWHFLFVTYNGTVLRMGKIVNGTITAEQWTTTINTGGTATPNIGTGSYSTADSFKGGIDQTAFWTRVLSDTELQTLENSTSGLAYSSWGGDATVSVNDSVSISESLSKNVISPFSAIVTDYITASESKVGLIESLVRINDSTTVTDISSFQTGFISQLNDSSSLTEFSKARAYIATDNVMVLKNKSVSGTAVGGNYPSVVKIDRNNFAIAYVTNSSYDLVVKTYNIDDYYNITFKSSYTYDSGTNLDPQLARIDSNHLILFHQDYTNTKGYIKIIGMTQSSYLTNSPPFYNLIGATLSNTEFCSTRSIDPSIVRINENHFAIAYTDTDNDGVIKTFRVNSDFSVTMLGSLEHDTTEGKNSSLELIDSTHIGLSYTSSNILRFKSFSLDGSYNLTQIENYAFGIDTTPSSTELIKLKSDVFLLTSSNTSNGSTRIRSFTVNGSYYLSSLHDTVEITGATTGTGRGVALQKINESRAIVSYTDFSSKGQLMLLKIDSGNLITGEGLTTYNAIKGVYPDFEYLDDSHFILGYTGYTSGYYYDAIAQIITTEDIYSVSVYDLITVSESKTVTRTIQTPLVSVFDSVTINEDYTPFRDDKISDTIQITENINLFFETLLISTYDEIITSDRNLVLINFIVERFWIGGTGNWNDSSNWSTTSGGIGGAPIPMELNDVYIDSYSGFDSGGTISLDGTYWTVRCHDFTSSSGHNYVIAYDTSDITIYGSAVFESSLTLTSDTWLYFLSDTSETITSNGCILSYVLFGGPNGEPGDGYPIFDSMDAYWTFSDDIYVFGRMRVYMGTVDTNNKNISVNDFQTRTLEVFNYFTKLKLGSSLFTVRGNFFYIEEGESSQPSPIIDAGTSTIKFTPGEGYGVNFTDDTNTSSLFTFYNIWYVPINTGSLYFTFDNIILNKLTVNNTGNSQISLEFRQGGTYTFNDFDVTGSSEDGSIYISNYSGFTSQHNLIKTSGVVNSRYLELYNSNASGGATWNALNSIDGSANSGWVFGYEASVSDTVSTTESLNTANFAASIDKYEQISLNEYTIALVNPIIVQVSDIITVDDVLNYTQNMSYDVFTIKEKIIIQAKNSTSTNKNNPLHKPQGSMYSQNTSHGGKYVKNSYYFYD